MKLALVLFLFAFSATLWAADPTMTAEERAKTIRLLQDTQKEFLTSVEGLTDAQWNYKSAPDRWSVGEVAEHIFRSEGLLMSAVQGALASPPNPDWETKTRGKTELVEKALPDRSHKAQAPEPIQPKGNWSRAEIIQQFKEARAKTLKFTAETELALKEHTLEHPFPFFGTLNAYQWLIYIPWHNNRHNQQIAEVKAGEGF